MTIIYGSLSICLYAAGASLLTAAAVVYKRNNLYEYYCLKHGKPVRAGGAEKTIGRLVVRNKYTGASRVEDVQKQEDTPQVRTGRMELQKQEGGTRVLGGSCDTTLLGKESGAEGKTAESAQGGRTWGRPTGKFRVTKSEVVIHTNRAIRVRAGTKGEKDED